jgi:hypothetical protein
MTKSKLIVSLAFAALLFNANVYAQDAITWSTQRNGAKVADTVALEDYLPLKDGVVYVEAVIEIPNVNRQELFSRAKLAIQKTFTSNKMGTSNYDAESGICSINNFYDISDMTAFSALATNNPITDQYNFNALLSIIVKDGKCKIKMEVPQYSYGQGSRYKTYSVPVSNLANKKQGNKRQRMRVLKTLNSKMLDTFNLVQKEMNKKLDNDF